MTQTVTPQDLERFQALVLERLDCLAKARPLEQDQLLTGEEVQAMIRVTRDGLQYLRDSGRLPYVLFNNRCRYKVTDVRQFIESSYWVSRRLHEAQTARARSFDAPGTQGLQNRAGRDIGKAIFDSKAQGKSNNLKSRRKK